jgi:hypothetical protein
MGHEMLHFSIRRACFNIAIGRALARCLTMYDISGTTYVVADANSRRAMAQALGAEQNL